MCFLSFLFSLFLSKHNVCQCPNLSFTYVQIDPQHTSCNKINAQGNKNAVKKENSQRNVTALLFTYQDVTKPFLTIEMILENLDSNERACQSLLARDIKWSFQIGCTLMEKCIFGKKWRF